MHVLLIIFLLNGDGFALPMRDIESCEQTIELIDPESVSEARCEIWVTTD